MSRHQVAPWFSVPDTTITSVEHPCIIRDVDKAIETLGGSSEIEQLVRVDGINKGLAVNLRPNDSMSRPAYSQAADTNNLLVKITVPARTGRKRKRGSTEPFNASEESLDEPKPVNVPLNGQRMVSPRRQAASSTGFVSTSRMLRSLRDNPERYNAEPVGVIEQTQRFRGLVDFQYSTSQSPFVQELRNHITPFEYPKLKEYRFNLSKGFKPNGDLIPPPNFTHFTVPFNYSYRQNPSVKSAIDSTGRAVTINTQKAAKVLTQLVSHEVAQIPTAPSGDLPPIDTVDNTTKKIYEELKELLDRRPIWTRRALTNNVSNKQQYLYTIRHALQYVGYMFRSGPWRDAIVRFGVDPRTDPKYRVYQTMMFQFNTKEDEAGAKQWEDARTKFNRTTKGKEDTLDSHIFDGRKVIQDGKVWQVCDIADPLIESLLKTTNLRRTCDKIDGWYHNGTWAKARTIMKNKIRILLQGEIPSNDSYSRIVDMPDIIDASNRHQTVVGRYQGTPREVQMASEVRTMANTSGPEMRTSAQSTGAAEEELPSTPKLRVHSPTELDEGSLSIVDPRVTQTMRELDSASNSIGPDHQSWPIADEGEVEAESDGEEDGSDLEEVDIYDSLGTRPDENIMMNVYDDNEEEAEGNDEAGSCYSGPIH
ncbi:hypothetical protein L228DRAFT_262871 [Xylona heveae TC161]|uniref:Transcription factor IIIC, subunit 5 n=1 Tax=Xylona heveae (strain CBS 132557 / TC161) TaxID=1328760 RepID=A0A165AAX8_XYLHT|nr:hypothetical protein L228DRAFT_262871 [Xylona heveae TC161]KZF20187.1 hypothetical protein L228DRAFT_262871 [Xylona heveae TC161]